MNDSSAAAQQGRQVMQNRIRRHMQLWCPTAGYFADTCSLRVLFVIKDLASFLVRIWFVVLALQLLEMFISRHRSGRGGLSGYLLTEDPCNLAIAQLVVSMSLLMSWSPSNFGLGDFLKPDE